MHVSQQASGDSPVLACAPAEEYFPSVDAAVSALSQCYLQRSVLQDREYIAGILEKDGLYQVTIVTGISGKDDVRIRIKPTENQLLVALWHTHGDHGLAREFFSPTDSAVVKRLQLPFYLTDPDGVIRRLDPGAKVYRIGKRLAGTSMRIPPGSAKGIVVRRH